MKYHYQKGLQKEHRLRKKALSFSVFSSLFVLVAGYGLVTFFAPAITAWPFAKGSEVAAAVTDTQPSKSSISVHVPRINSTVTVDGSKTKISGKPDDEGVLTVGAPYFELGLNPWQTRQNSPLYRLDEVQPRDEVFVDYRGTRYAFAVTTKDDAGDEGLVLEAIGASGIKVYAKTVGVVAWQDGKPRIETPAAL